MRRKLLSAVVVLGLPLSLLAFGCGRDNEVPGPKPLEQVETDSAVATDTSPAVDAADAADATVSTGCSDTDFNNNDYSADGGMAVPITFPTTATPAQYMPNCVTIKAGGQVHFIGDFSMHPFEGDPPFQNVSTGMDVTFMIDNPGIYAFHCQLHPGIMYGAVKVVP